MIYQSGMVKLLFFLGALIHIGKVVVASLWLHAAEDLSCSCISNDVIVGVSAPSELQLIGLWVTDSKNVAVPQAYCRSSHPQRQVPEENICCLNLFLEQYLMELDKL